MTDSRRRGSDCDAGRVDAACRSSSERTPATARRLDRRCCTSNPAATVDKISLDVLLVTTRSSAVADRPRDVR